MIDEKHYTYRVTWSEEDEEFVALCAEFPSLSFLAKDRNQAIDGLTEIIFDILKDMENCGEIPPQPLAQTKFSGKFLVRIPPEQHRDLVIRAAEEGVSLNRYISSKLV